MELCPYCGTEMEDTEFGMCAECADSFADEEDDLSDFFENRFDMETEAEYRERKANS